MFRIVEPSHRICCGVHCSGLIYAVSGRRLCTNEDIPTRQEQTASWPRSSSIHSGPPDCTQKHRGQLPERQAPPGMAAAMVIVGRTTGTRSTRSRTFGLALKIVAPVRSQTIGKRRANGGRLQSFRLQHRERLRHLHDRQDDGEKKQPPKEHEEGEDANDAQEHVQRILPHDEVFRSKAPGIPPYLPACRTRTRRNACCRIARARQRRARSRVPTGAAVGFLITRAAQSRSVPGRKVGALLVEMWQAILNQIPRRISRRSGRRSRA